MVRKIGFDTAENGPCPCASRHLDRNAQSDGAAPATLDQPVHTCPTYPGRDVDLTTRSEGADPPILN